MTSNTTPPVAGAQNGPLWTEERIAQGLMARYATDSKAITFYRALVPFILEITGELEAQITRVEDHAAKMYEYGMATEREHQNRLSRLVMERHEQARQQDRQTIDALKAQLAALAALESHTEYEPVPDDKYTFGVLEGIEISDEGRTLEARVRASDRWIDSVVVGLPEGIRLCRVKEKVAR